MTYLVYNKNKLLFLSSNKQLVDRIVKVLLAKGFDLGIVEEREV